MSVPITSSILTSTTGYPIPTTFAAGTTQRISIVNGPAYVTLESRRQSLGTYTSSANFSGAIIDGASPSFSNVVDTSIVSGNFIAAGVVGQKGRTGSLLVNINRDLPANEIFLKIESSNPNTYISEIVNDASFVFNINTANTGPSGDDEFFFQLHSTFGGGNTTSSVDWGDGRTNLLSSSAQSEISHSYSGTGGEGEYTIKMTPTTGTVGIKGIRFDDRGDDTKITRIENWGSLNIDQNAAFEGCSNLTCTAPDVPFIFTTLPSFLFNGCSSLTSLDVTRWDTSAITNIGFMFVDNTNLSDFDPSGWDVSSVTNMNSIFKNCMNLDFSLANWDLSSATNINNIFKNTTGAGTTGISTANYDATLIGWAANPNTPDTLTTDFGGSTYTGTSGTLASSSRSTLEQKGWTITDGGAA